MSAPLGLIDASVGLITVAGEKDESDMRDDGTMGQFGYLPQKHNLSLNPYSEARFSKCPDCHDRTGQHKLPLLIYVDPENLVALNYTDRYCAL